MKLGLRLACLMIPLVSSGGAAAQSTAWDESVSGDLSNSGLSPTALVVGVGTNRVAGTTGNSGQGVDRDYFTFTVPAGMALQTLKVLGGTSVSGGSSFIAIQAGAQVTVTTSGGGSENLLGFAHYGNDVIDTDILPQLVFNFAGSLPSGAYAVWVQETGGPASYEFEFGLAPAVSADIPTLPEWGLLLLGSVLLGQWWRQNRLRPPRHFG